MRLEKITTRDRQPASLLQTGDQGSQLDRPDHACPEIRIERADLAPERSELEAGIEPTGDVGMVQSTEAEKPGIESIAEEGAEDGVWVAQPVQRFVADTSWTGTISFLEMGSPDVIVSTSTEASECLEAGESDREERASIPNLRTATLPDPGTPPAGGRRRASENEVWSKDSRHKPGIEPEIPRPKTGPDLPSAKDILAAVSMRPSALSGKPSTRMNEDQGKPTERREPGQWFPHLWLAWPPAALLVLGMGIGGSLLSLRWAGDSFNASVVSQHLLPRSENPGREKPLPESVVPPEPSWWQTTPLHLAQWGVYLGRSGSEDDRAEEASGIARGGGPDLTHQPDGPAGPSTARIEAERARQLASSPGPQPRRSQPGLDRPVAPPGGKKGGRDPGLPRGPPDRLPASTRRRPPSRSSTTTPPCAAISCPARRRRRPSSVSCSPTPTGPSRNGPRPCPGTRSPRWRRPGSSASRSGRRPRPCSSRSSTRSGRAEQPARNAAVQTGNAAAEAHALLSHWSEAEQQYRQAIDQIERPHDQAVLVVQPGEHRAPAQRRSPAQGRARGGPGRSHERRHQPAGARAPAGLRAPWPAPIQRDQGQLRRPQRTGYPRADPKDEQPWR